LRKDHGKTSPIKSFSATCSKASNPGIFEPLQTAKGGQIVGGRPWTGYLNKFDGQRQVKVSEVVEFPESNGVNGQFTHFCCIFLALPVAREIHFSCW
jgi:hypothetical protein